MALTRLMKALESEIVVIRWQLRDGTFYDQRVTVPPKAVRDAQIATMKEP